MNIKKGLEQELQKNAQIIDHVGEQVRDLKAVRDYMVRRIAESELTPTQQKKMELYEFIYNQLVGNKWTESELLDLIMTKAKCKRPVAIHLLNDTKELFTTVLCINKQWEYKKQLHMNETLMRKADIAGDYRSAAAFAKNMIAINDRIEVIEKEIEEFKGHTLVVSADPSIIGVDKANPKEVSKLLSDLKDKYGFDGIEDAEIVEDEQ